MTEKKAEGNEGELPRARLTLTEIEQDDWGLAKTGDRLADNVHALRHKPLEDFTPEDLCELILQQISLPTVVPLALAVLRGNPFTEAWAYAGDLLHDLLIVDRGFWEGAPELMTEFTSLLPPTPIQGGIYIDERGRPDEEGLIYLGESIAAMLDEHINRFRKGLPPIRR